MTITQADYGVALTLFIICAIAMVLPLLVSYAIRRRKTEESAFRLYSDMVNECLCLTIDRDTPVELLEKLLPMLEYVNEYYRRKNHSNNPQVNLVQMVQDAIESRRTFVP